jgi:uncharacterized protein
MWRRRSFRFAALLIGLLLVIPVVFSWWAASELMAPSRRPLQDYHTEFLADAAAHGVKVQSFALKDGTPCLMIEPDAALPLGSRGLKIREQLAAKALHLPVPGQILGTLVLIHGRNGRKEDYLLISERFCAVGFRCLIPDLPAHGDHPASQILSGYGEGQLANSVLGEAAARYGFDPEAAGLMGMSLGGSVALHGAAANPLPWKALAIIASFDALQPLIVEQSSKRVGPWLGGLWAESTAWTYEFRTGVAVDMIRPASRIASLTIPTLIAHGTNDRVIPIEAGRRLYDALPPALEKQWIEIPGADHDNVLVTDFPIYATIAEWMLRHVVKAP